MQLNNCDPVAIGKRIREKREENGLQQKDLALKIGTTDVMMNYWEAGSRPIKSDYIIALSNFFDVPCDYLLRGIKPKNVTVSRELGLTSEVIDVLRLSEEIVSKDAQGEDWSSLTFMCPDANGKLVKIKNKKSALQYAKNTVECANLLLGEPFANDMNSDRVIDFIMNFIRADVSEGEAYNLYTEDNIEVAEVISGSDILASKLVLIQQTLERLRKNNRR